MFLFLFLAIQLNDANADKLGIIKTIPNYWQQEQTNYSINESALYNELKSIIMNIEYEQNFFLFIFAFLFSRKDEENMLNRHNEHYYPQKVHRVPSVR